ncbi:hypothetical protein [Rhodopseudomonas palustris]|uniref:hypothetical protein n=1 Tax=Rhodopseudomonas palustris TaxID=1076 RepID=UPI0032E04FBA
MTFTMDKFVPVTVPVQVVTKEGNLFTAATTTVDPNPVSAELQPAKPVRHRRGRSAPRKPRAAASAPAAASSAFPAPDAAAR